jgi:release factor glutamine methyltransferase
MPDMRVPTHPAALAALLATEGFLSADDEAAALLARAGDDRDLLDSLVARRLTGEPLAWITGTTVFCDRALRIDAGVYVPRWLSEPLARRAVERLPQDGVGVDLCTGSGAVAFTLHEHRPGARVLATDIDPAAVACATANGVDAYCGDLFAPLPPGLEGRVDVVVAVVPYVPTPELPLLQRDTFTFEAARSYDGGADGTDVLRRVLAESPRYLRRGGAILLEVGGDQDRVLADELARLGYADVRTLTDEDGDLRGIEATLSRTRRP